MLKRFTRTLLESALVRRGYRLMPNNLFDWPLIDLEFNEIFDRQARFGWQEKTGPKIQRMYMVRNVLLSVRGLGGNWAECGVFRGSTALIMAEYDRRYMLLPPGRAIHLFDSFAGLSNPTANDSGTHLKTGDFRAGVAEVQCNLAGYEQIIYHSGWIPDAFSQVRSERFAFAHIDLDFYEPVRDSLEFFLPRMVHGGIVVLDDYGCAETPGALKATNEVAARHGCAVAALPYGQAMIIVHRL